MIKTPFILQSSQLTRYFLILVHALSILVVFLLPLPIGLKYGLGALCLLNLVDSWRKYVSLKGQRVITKLWQRNSRFWQLETAQGERFIAKLSGESICTPLLVVLNFRRPKQWFATSVVIPKDAMDADSFRRLRVRLRFGRE